MKPTGETGSQKAGSPLPQDCQGAMQHCAEYCPDWATLGTNPRRAWGTSSLETGSGSLSLPALQEAAEKEFQGPTLGF